MLSKLTTVVILLLKVSNCYGANILYLAPMASPSHHIWNGAIFNELAKRGHNVTVLTPSIETDPPSNVHYIFLENQTKSVENYVKKVLNSQSTFTPFYDTYALLHSYSVKCSVAVNTNGFRTLFNYPDNFQFNLIINDITPGLCFQPFVHRFNYPPVIVVSAYSQPSYLSESIGDHHHYAYVPHNVLQFTEEMTLLQRLYNFLMYVEETLLWKYYLNAAIDEIAAKFFGPNVPSIDELERRTALAFISANPVMDYVAPLPPNVIPVGGVQIKDPTPLGKDLKEFIDSSKKGVVVFSLGTNFLSNLMPREKQDQFIKVFSDLGDYNFLWKFESVIPISGLPNNVRIESWLPISDLLADSKVKAIIFHGGMLTTQEAIWRGVPMIIMPFALDQYQNLNRVRKLGVGEGLDYLNLKAIDVKTTLLKVLQNSSYATNAKKWSTLIQDVKEKPLDRAIWWIEWLLRNPNCDHLKSPVLRLGHIVGNGYDVITVVVLFVTFLLVVIVKLISFCIKRFVISTKTIRSVHIKVE